MDHQNNALTNPLHPDNLPDDPNNPDQLRQAESDDSKKPSANSCCSDLMSKLLECCVWSCYCCSLGADRRTGHADPVILTASRTDESNVNHPLCCWSLQAMQPCSDSIKECPSSCASSVCCFFTSCKDNTGKGIKTALSTAEHVGDAAGDIAHSVGDTVKEAPIDEVLDCCADCFKSLA